MKFYFDFPFILTCLVLLSGIISLIDIFFLAKKRKASGRAKQPLVAEYSRSFFPILLLVWLVRSFLVSPYRVPSGSLAPTILPGDLIVVNQYAYGLRLPVSNWKIINVGEPQVGDIALFRWPPDPSVLFIKRVIGTPGDHVVYHDKVLTINGVTMKQKPLGMDLDFENNLAIPVKVEMENLSTLAHKIFVHEESTKYDNFDIVVPQGNYFMMGDNRDGSDDSRDWGFVPEENLIGKGFGIWFSWDAENYKVRWSRIGKAIR